MIFYLAAMQNIDKSIYEAAKLEGVSPVQTFFHITVPLLAGDPVYVRHVDDWYAAAVR